MEVSAKARFVRVSPRKTRLVAANIKDQTVAQALNQLKLTTQKPAKELYKVLYSAVSNAQQTALDVDSLYVKRVLVDKGPFLKRIKPRAMGRATRILKKTSHITIIIDEE
ncbi:MAG: 50S ribosomal protein L22 [Desulfohalobiaceae bacterium]